MKDFYDVYRLLTGGNYQQTVLKTAIINTIQQRQTVCPANHPLFGVNFGAAEQRNRQWKAFLRKSNLESSLEFTEVMRTIIKELHPIYQQLDQ